VCGRRMHDDEVDVDVSLVRRLLAAQFPQWADLPLEQVQHAGTDNAIYRLGDDMSVRLPRIHWATGQAEKEQEWLPRLAPHLPLAVPVPLAIGMPGEGYPWRWSVSPWLGGEEATADRIADLQQAATDLARFVAALQRIDPTGGPLAADHNLRGVPPAMRDSSTREAIDALYGVIDTAAVTAAWEAAVQAPDWDRAPVWFHGDVLAGNLLVERGRLSAVIDFGGLGVGDPACDAMSAWSLFTGKSRDVFRSALAVDDATWARARGCALSQALIALPYYMETNPVIVARSRHTIDEILADHASGP
jgi:aminoglycoside phosphotransferase (APT) family kinase protein